MSYTVMVGLGGYNGWNLLKRTEGAQMQVIRNSAEVKQKQNHFFSNFEKVKTADDLLSDYRLLSVTLTAFGLDDDARNRAFLKKVIESDLSDEKSFANKLSDKRYLKLAQALSLGDSTAESKSTKDDIFNLFIERTFEIRVGEQDPALRQALNARRELSEMASHSGSVEAFWYKVLGSTALRGVFDTAFNLPSSFGRLPIDRQMSDYVDRAAKMFGSASPDIFQDSENIEKLVTTYLLREQVGSASVNSPYSVALTILKSNT